MPWSDLPLVDARVCVYVCVRERSCRLCPPLPARAQERTPDKPVLEFVLEEPQEVARGAAAVVDGSDDHSVVFCIGDPSPPFSLSLSASLLLTAHIWKASVSVTFCLSCSVCSELFVREFALGEGR